MNPLLDFSGLPRFADIRPEHVTPAVNHLLEENRATLDRIRNEPATPDWENFVEPLEDANERLSRAWGQVSHLNAVVNSPELRDVYNANLPLVTQYYAELGQDHVLFEKFALLREGDAYSKLNRARKKIVENALRDFRLGGAHLPPAEKVRFLQIQEELSSLSSKFNDNLLDATNNFALHVQNREELTGIPDDVLHMARAAAEQESAPGWKFSLHAPSYLPVLQYADNRALREKMYRGYSTRASEMEMPGVLADIAGKFDNAPLIQRILELRQEEARILGFDCYAEVSLVAKMAASPHQVLDFLNELATRARLYGERDLGELREFAGNRLGLANLEAWDIAYASEKLRVERYAFSDQEVKQYLPETSVLPGMFKLVQELYGILITPVTEGIQLWHPDVKFFRISDKEGKLIGSFYLDLYARPGKRGGGWMDDAVSRRRVRGSGKAPGTSGSGTSGSGTGGLGSVPDIQAPVAYLNCNFSAPVQVNGKLRPALFTHDEVITLFHEFGHGLHHLLTQVEDLGVSGIHGVEWDAVELPSQFMENFCWEWEVLSKMTKHVDTGEPMPRALFDKMLAAKNFQAGMQTLRQIEFALFDMHLHTDFNPRGQKTVQQLLDEIRRLVAVIIPPEFNRFPNSFAHIFGGGYAAGYYSYKWAEVLSADAYSLFEESAGGTVVNPQTGALFWNEILAVGGSRTALESFVAFRGREPKIDALLRHNGMVA